MSQFHSFIRKKLSDERLKKNYRRILDGNNQNRRELVGKVNLEEGADYFAQLRDYGHHTRKSFVNRLPELLEKLETNCRRNRIEVHYALDGGEACAQVEEIARHHQAQVLIKGKSMITEEIHLNRYLMNRGYEVIESDLGEYILQLDEDTPSHLVAPAIHKTAADFSAVLKEKFPQEYIGEGDEEITLTVRNILRQKYMEADIGVTGVNFAVASRGALVLVENEGNGRLTTSMPRVHIALMSIEKVIEDFDQIPPLLELLTVSATGQLITNYINVIMGPRRPETEEDGPDEVHLIILDNGRTRILSDPLLRESLLCIRCGACMDNCPVYAQVTGHSYQSEIPGPIGKIIIPQLHGLKDKGLLPVMSSLCGACEEVCPVRIPIPRILLHLRGARAQTHPSVLDSGKSGSWGERFLWWGWAWVYSHPKLYRLFRKKLGWFRGMVSLIFPLIPLLGRWTRHRSAPRISGISLEKLMRENHNYTDSLLQPHPENQEKE